MSKTSKVISIIAAITILAAVGALGARNFMRYGLSATSSSRPMAPAVYPGRGGAEESDADYQSLGIGYGKSTGLAANQVAADYAPTAPAPGAAPSPANERLIVRSGYLSLVVKDVRAALKGVGEFAIKQGGFIVASNVEKQGLALVGTITVRIPSKQFDQGIVDAKTLGEVVSEKVDGNDVTEEYVDLNARLKNLRATEAQFLEIMKRAEKIPDVLAVQNELTRVRADIESLEGRIKYLRQSADLSSLTVYLSTDPSVLPVVEPEQSAWKPLAILKDAVRSLVQVGKAIGSAIIWLAVFAPLWGAAFLVGWLLVRRRHRGG